MLQYKLLFLVVIFPTLLIAQSSTTTDSLIKCATHFEASGNYQRALENYQQANRILEHSKNDDNLKLAGLYHSMAFCLYMTNHYSTAFAYLDSAITSNQSIANQIGVAENYHLKGRMYRYLEEPDSAQFYLNKALHINIQHHNKKGEAANLEQLGYGFLQLKNYDSALVLISKAASIDDSLQNNKNLSRDYYSLGIVYQELNDYENAILWMEKSLHYELEESNLRDIYTRYKKLSFYCYKNQSFEKCIEHTLKALEYGEKAFALNEEDQFWMQWRLGFSFYNLDNHVNAIQNLTNAYNSDYLISHPDNYTYRATLSRFLGYSHSAVNNLNQAIEYHKQCLEYEDRLHRTTNTPILLNSLGSKYKEIGKLDSSLIFYQKEYYFSTEHSDTLSLVESLTGIGSVYFDWGAYDKALQFVNQAYSIDSLYGTNSKSDFVNLVKGNILYRLNKHNQALRYYYRSVQICKEEGYNYGLSSGYCNIGLVYLKKHEYDSALFYFNQSIDTLSVNQYDNQSAYNNIGLCYFKLGNYKDALRNYELALKCSKTQNDYGNSSTLISLGLLYQTTGEIKKSIEYLKRFNQAIESIRETTDQQHKRDYMASAIEGYQFLAESYINSNQPDSAFLAMEKSSARYLLEQLNSSDTLATYVSMHVTTPDISVIKFGNINQPKSLRIVKNGNKYSAAQVKVNVLKKDLQHQTMHDSMAFNEELRGAAVLKSKKSTIEIHKNDNFIDQIVNRYRELLLNPISNNDDLTDLSQKIYSFLFKDIEAYLQDNNELLILPDGCLALLPFETLIMPDGRYLIEKYNIRYAPSLSVLNLISDKPPVKSGKLLVVGGIDYSKNQYLSTSELQNTKNTYQLINEFDKLQNKTDTDLTSFYNALGYRQWTDIPASKKEIETIADYVKVTWKKNVVLGDKASEKIIKTLSVNGELSQYNIIHFATHGMVVPAIPELSALVLSKGNDSINDGYLNAMEIAKLDINANFVNLSACETGLGKIYDGEGVVGLTQSFLIAGARGISVSLWQVADESTQLFMTNVYKLVFTKNLSFKAAIHQTKLQFIHGDFGEKYKSPFYWAPFVYYGL